MTKRNDDPGVHYGRHFRVQVARHDTALTDTGFQSLVIAAGAQHMIFLDDMPYPFKVNPHFKVWLPVLDNPNCFLIITPGQKPQLIFYKPVDFWHKVADAPAGYWVEFFDIHFISSVKEARRLVSSSEGRTAFIGEWDDSYADWGLDATNPKELVDRLHYERACKTEYEIASMRIANDIAAEGHRVAEQAFRSGASEFEIHLEYLLATRQSEAQLPYGNIIALNQNGAVLHYQQLERQRPDASNRLSFLIDAGATHNGYASDVTRTYSNQHEEFERLIAAVEAAQQQLCAEVRPGVDYRDLHLLTHRKVAEILVELEFAKIDADALVERRITSTFFPHGLGHFIGLQVHDVGGFMRDSRGNVIPQPEGHPFLRLTRPAEIGHVFTIEPGFYFIESLLGDLRASENGQHVRWDRVDSFRKYGGVRIEDDLVVTADGSENLTRDAFDRLM